VAQIKSRTVTVLVLDEEEKATIARAADPKQLSSAVKTLTDALHANAKQVKVLAKDEPNGEDLDRAEVAAKDNARILEALPESEAKTAAQEAVEAALSLIAQARGATASQAA
jgi:hypothetical protein